MKQGIILNGATQGISLSSQPKIFEGFTISGWLKFTDNNFYATREVFNNNQFFLRKDSSGEGGKLSIFVKLADGSVEPRAQTTTVMAPDIWYHVAGTWDGVRLKIYLDGSSERSQFRVGALTSTTVDARFGQGEQRNITGNFFAGILDELTIFDRALTSSEIKGIYNAGSFGMIKPASSVLPTPTPVLVPTAAPSPTATLVPTPTIPQIPQTETNPYGLPDIVLEEFDYLDFRRFPVVAINRELVFNGYSSLTIQQQNTAVEIINAQLSKILSGFGASIIDGQMFEGEWDRSAFLVFDVSVSGGKTEGVLQVMNDDNNLYLAVWFDEGALSRNSITFDFFKDPSGQHRAGDDNVTVYSSGLLDNTSYCTPACVTRRDVDVGGTADGTGAILNNRGRTIFELSHPINSSDDENDLNLESGDTIFFRMSLLSTLLELRIANP